MPYNCDPSIEKPSEELEALLMGRIAWDDAPEAIRSWARKPIFDAAKELIAMPDKGTRRNALGKIPAPIRPMVEAEILRLWKMR
jgi:hypothetical protein